MTGKPCFRIERCAEGFVVSLHGRGTLRESPILRDFVGQCLDKERLVVLDLSNGELLDSTFLGCLVGLHKHSLQYAGRLFRIYADRVCQLRLLTCSGLDQLFDYSPSLPEVSGDVIVLDYDHCDLDSLGKHVMHSHRLLADLGGDDAEAFRSIADRLQKELNSDDA